MKPTYEFTVRIRVKGCENIPAAKKVLKESLSALPHSLTVGEGKKVSGPHVDLSLELMRFLGNNCVAIPSKGWSAPTLGNLQGKLDLSSDSMKAEMQKAIDYYGKDYLVQHVAILGDWSNINNE